MAKISTGPLAAGITGPLGPVVFAQTRWGQVVQSKARARVYTTPAALATKAAFGKASKGVNTIGRETLQHWDATLGELGKSGRGQLIRAFAAMFRGDDPPQWPTIRWSHGAPTLGTPFASGPRWKIPYSWPDGSTEPANGFGITYYPDGSVRRFALVDLFADGHVVIPSGDRFPCHILVFHAETNSANNAPGLDALSPFTPLTLLTPPP